MKYLVLISEEAKKDTQKLKFSNTMKLKFLEKAEQIATNPLDKSQGGYGEALRGNLKGLYKFRFDRDYRVVYKIVEENHVMKIVVVGLRKNNTVYEIAAKRL